MTTNTHSLEERYARLHSLYTSAGQSHVFTFYPELSEIERNALLDQLEGMEIERVNRIYEKAVEGEKKEKEREEVRRSRSIRRKANAAAAAIKNEANGNGNANANANGNGHGNGEDTNQVDENEILPLPADACASIVPPMVGADGQQHASSPTKEMEASKERWNDLGLSAIGSNEVAVLLMAGGQGTRLGSSAPKGCYDLKLPSGKSLFALQAERIKRLQELASLTLSKSKSTADSASSARIPWYVMTSGPTRKETEAFFEAQNFFGLDKRDVIFFNQGTLPALSNEGKIMLATKSSVAVAPDGNGGLYAAIRKPLDVDGTSGGRSVLSDMQQRGIKYIHAYCVDNCLVRVADPVFIGYCIERKSVCGAKVVRKESPHESVGVLAMRGKSFSVVEYSELSKDKAEERDASGELAFRAANIANHFYTLDFLLSTEAMEPLMAFHIARKKIPTVDFSSGEPIKPSEPNGMKLELFVFDVFPFTQELGVLEVERKEEFSPLKNAPGTKSDNPETSRRDLLAQQKRWLVNAGAKVEEGVDIEVNPLLSYAGEGLSLLNGKIITKSGNLENLQDISEFTS